MGSYESKDTRPVHLLAKSVQDVMKEPILSTLLERSNITRPQLETLLIDLVIEDAAGMHLPYEQKAGLRSKTTKRKGVSRGAFNRTLQQARRNVMRSIYTMVLLAYLGLFDYSIFRPFEEISAKIADYRRIREVLAGKVKLSTEDAESYRAAERVVLDALEELAGPLILKSSSSKRKQGPSDVL
ncbi:MAG: hypothetical protein ACTSYL_08970 [Candidatus Thorarchaeota archaeon]